MSAFFYNVVHRFMVSMTGIMRRVYGSCMCILLCGSATVLACPKPTLGALILPYFFKNATLSIGDTTFEMRCYNKQDSVIKILNDFGEVRYVCRWMHYLDRLHPYKDFDGTYKPLPVSVITARYEKMGTTKWMYINYLTKEYKTYTAHPETIVDSFINPIVDVPDGSVYYYKVSEN